MFTYYKVLGFSKSVNELVNQESFLKELMNK